jgi:hypothetical protein
MTDYVVTVTGSWLHTPDTAFDEWFRRRTFPVPNRLVQVGKSDAFFFVARGPARRLLGAALAERELGDARASEVRAPAQYRAFEGPFVALPERPPAARTPLGVRRDRPAFAALPEEVALAGLDWLASEHEPVLLEGDANALRVARLRETALRILLSEIARCAPFYRPWWAWPWRWRHPAFVAGERAFDADSPFDPADPSLEVASRFYLDEVAGPVASVRGIREKLSNLERPEQALRIEGAGEREPIDVRMIAEAMTGPVAEAIREVATVLAEALHNEVR